MHRHIKYPYIGTKREKHPFVQHETVCHIKVNNVSQVFRTTYKRRKPSAIAAISAGIGAVKRIGSPVVGW